MRDYGWTLIWAGIILFLAGAVWVSWRDGGGGYALAFGAGGGLVVAVCLAIEVRQRRRV